MENSTKIILKMCYGDLHWFQLAQYVSCQRQMFRFRNGIIVYQLPRRGGPYSGPRTELSKDV